MTPKQVVQLQEIWAFKYGHARFLARVRERLDSLCQRSGRRLLACEIQSWNGENYLLVETAGGDFEAHTATEIAKGVWTPEALAERAWLRMNGPELPDG